MHWKWHSLSSAIYIIGSAGPTKRLQRLSLACNGSYGGIPNRSDSELPLVFRIAVGSRVWRKDFRGGAFALVQDSAGDGPLLAEHHLREVKQKNSHSFLPTKKTSSGSFQRQTKRIASRQLKANGARWRVMVENGSLRERDEEVFSIASASRVKHK